MKFVLIILFGFSSVAFAGGGNDVGNGGGTVTCTASSENDFVGDLFPDYVLEFDPANPALPATNLAESLDRIQRGLLKMPALYWSFFDFRKDLFSDRDYSAPHIWEKSLNPLAQATDVIELLTRMPKNCASFQQLVIRADPRASGYAADKRIFKYLAQDIAKLNPLQQSFLVVHEWIWELTQSVEASRRFNYLLHSTKLESWSADEWQSLLTNQSFASEPRFNPFDGASCPLDFATPAHWEDSKNRYVLSPALGFGGPRVWARIKTPSGFQDTTTAFAAQLDVEHLFVVIEGGIQYKLRSVPWVDGVSWAGDMKWTTACAVFTDNTRKCYDIRDRNLVKLRENYVLDFTLNDSCMRFHGTAQTARGLEEFVVMLRK